MLVDYLPTPAATRPGWAGRPRAPARRVRPARPGAAGRRGPRAGRRPRPRHPVSSRSGSTARGPDTEDANGSRRARRGTRADRSGLAEPGVDLDPAFGAGHLGRRPDGGRRLGGDARRGAGTADTRAGRRHRRPRVGRRRPAARSPSSEVPGEARVTRSCRPRAPGWGGHGGGRAARPPSVASLPRRRLRSRDLRPPTWPSAQVTRRRWAVPTRCGVRRCCWSCSVDDTTPPTHARQRSSARRHGSVVVLAAMCASGPGCAGVPERGGRRCSPGNRGSCLLRCALSTRGLRLAVAAVLRTGALTRPPAARPHLVPPDHLVSPPTSRGPVRPARPHPPRRRHGCLDRAPASPRPSAPPTPAHDRPRAAPTDRVPRTRPSAGRPRHTPGTCRSRTHQPRLRCARTRGRGACPSARRRGDRGGGPRRRSPRSEPPAAAARAPARPPPRPDARTVSAAAPTLGRPPRLRIRALHRPVMGPVRVGSARAG